MAHYCAQIDNIPKTQTDIYRAESYRCKITGQRCVASTFEDPDPAHPASLGCEARYDHEHARLICPVFNISNEIAATLRKHLSLEKRVKS